MSPTTSTGLGPGVRSGSDRQRGFRTDIQGLRALAVGLVVLYHAGIPFVPGGYVGVDVFFVISGFLISSHLLEALQRARRVSFAQFYARRARRILPASFVVAALTAVAVVVVYPPLGAERVLGDALATVLYLPNVRFAIENTDYLADHSPSPYQHYWSLGVEEQFYLLWPVVLLLLFLLARRRGRTLTVLIAALALASFVACVVLTPVQQPVAFFLLPTRAWELLAGALVGILLQERRRAHRPGVAAAGGWMGVAMILGTAALFSEATVFPGFAAVLPVAGTALVIYFGVQSAPGGPTAALSVRPMQFVGLISYSLYLVHWPLLLIPQAAVGDSRPLPLWATVLLGVVLAIPLAYLLYRWVETPLRAPAALTRRRPRVTLLGTAAVTAVLALGIWAAIGWASTRPMPTGEAVAAAPDFPSSPPAATGFVPANLTPSLEDAATDIPRLYADDCHHDTGVETVQDCIYGAADAPVRIALFGDSHSAQWFPAIDEYAREHGEVAISTFTKSSCPAVSATVLEKNSPYTSCDRWRDAVIEHLVADPPELVIVSSYAWYELAGIDDDTERREVWVAGLASTVRMLTASGAEVLVIADTPRFDSSPPACVSADPLDVSACAGDRSLVLDEALTRAEANATAAAGGGFADLTEYVCGAAECPVIVDDMLVYRDVNHLTSTYVRYLQPALAEAIDALLR